MPEGAHLEVSSSSTGTGAPLPGLGASTATGLAEAIDAPRSPGDAGNEGEPRVPRPDGSARREAEPSQKPTRASRDGWLAVMGSAGVAAAILAAYALTRRAPLSAAGLACRILTGARRSCGAHPTDRSVPQPVNGAASADGQETASAASPIPTTAFAPVPAATPGVAHVKRPAQRGGAAPLVVTPRSASPANCDPPYRLDEQGVRIPKAECL